MAASRKKGKWGGGTVPFGYKVENRRLVPEEAEVSIVNRIYNRYLEGYARAIRLTRLSLAIIHRIIANDAPDGLSLAKLRTNLTEKWQEQETILME